MDILIDNDNVNIVQSVASASTLISSLAGEARDLILSKFPKDYFKSVYMETSSTINQEKLNNMYNKTSYKIPYPSLSITPEISLDDPIGGMEKNYATADPDFNILRKLGRNYISVLRDPNNKLGIYYTSDYITTNFNFKLTLNSYVKNIDTAFYLKSKFQRDFYVYLNKVKLQTEIPKTFIKVLSNLKMFNLDQQSGLEEMQMYMIQMGKSKNNIELKKNLSTGKDCFFLDVERNILSLFTDLDAPSSVIRDSQVEGEYTITFRIQMSTYLPNAFILNIHKDMFETVDPELLEMTADDLESGFMTTSVSNVILSNDVIEFKDALGKTQVGHLIYKNTLTADLADESNIISLLDMMPEGFKKIHAFVKDKFSQKELESLMYIRLADRRGIINDFKFDIKNMEIKFENLQYEVRILIYINRLFYESMIVAMNKDVFFSNDGVLSALYVRDDNNSDIKKVRVLRFVNDDNMKDNDLNMSLRLKTTYGIGYVDISDMKNKYSDSYRICVGYNKSGEPIIKKLNSVRRK